MSWMPKAERVAQVGDGTAAPQRLNKSVSKVQLAKMRTSCQVNYPESASKHRVGRTVGGRLSLTPLPRRDGTENHLRRPRSAQVFPSDIKKGVTDSFRGNHSGLWSDWVVTSERSHQNLESLVKERTRVPSPAGHPHPPLYLPLFRGRFMTSYL